MTSAHDSASVFANTYHYNGADQRASKSDNGGTFAYTRDGDEVDDAVLSDGTAIYNHGAGSSSLISEVRGSGGSATSKYYHSDALGSTGALTSSSGTTTDTHVTDAFGMSVTGTGTTPTPFGFVGQGGYQTDSDTGLMLCGHRFYDSCTGRFLSRDPIQAGYNWYTYCNNDPINATDATGLAPFWQTIGDWGKEFGGAAKAIAKLIGKTVAVVGTAITVGMYGSMLATESQTDAKIRQMYEDNPIKAGIDESKEVEFEERRNDNLNDYHKAVRRTMRESIMFAISTEYPNSSGGPKSIPN